DNGWNSELAVHNIENTITRLGFDLYSYIVDWQEFRDLQRAYFRADVVDIEVLTDHGFMAVLYRQARKHGIRFVLGGMNIVTEGILPSNWIYDKSDVKNIRAIHYQHGEIPQSRLRSYPFLSPVKRRILDEFLGLEVVSPLNWIDYSYDVVKNRIAGELNWRDYGGKHYESVFTRFYQGHILPEKFGFDKRRAHLSTLICSGQITRDQALAEIRTPGYDPNLLDVDRTFTLKKLGFSSDELDEYLNRPRAEHRDYAHRRSVLQKYPWLRHVRRFTSGLRRSA
ncbi:MAG: hypothetical protein KDA77_23660, partial [Planctomycetaceae bacterium]|nr:hypothetical protein [Planctomycetaceae bacterium]